LAVLHYETASTTQQPRGEHRGTIKGCKIAGATTWQGQGNHTFTTWLKYSQKYNRLNYVPDYSVKSNLQQRAILL